MRWMKIGLGVSILTGTIWIIITGSAIEAIWPSLVALSIVWLSGSAITGLLSGAVVGAILLSHGQLWSVPELLVGEHLLPHFTSSWKVGAILFTFLLGGFVHILERGGLLQSLLVLLLNGKSPRRLETGAAAFGILCFFDGLANSLMVGRVFQPMADKAGMSRLRLAYIVDTTSAAVACLAFISTWIAFQLSMIREGFLLAGREGQADVYTLFFQSIPYNFYAIFALFLMIFVIWRQWNIGPMKDSVASMQTGTSLAEEGQLPDTSAETSGGYWRVGIPLVVLIAYIFTGIYFNGAENAGIPIWPLTASGLAMAFGKADVPVILVTGSLISGILAWLFYPGQKWKEAGALYVEGMQLLFQPVIILICAWMVSSTLNSLGADEYLGHLVGGRIAVEFLPGIIFVISAIVAFTTGTSWGTMGLVMPLAIPLCFQTGGGEAAAIIPIIIGAVFSGAVFGDHCSPLSDTTIVSAFSCNVDPVDHVKTQLPYAMLAAVGALLFGFLPSGFMKMGIFSSFLGTILFFGAILFLQRRGKNSSRAGKKA